MRIFELLRSKPNCVLSEEENYGENVTVDWNKLKATLTVIATDPDLKGVKPVDAIMFLGLIGDPKADEWNVKIKGPARIGVLNDKGMSLKGMDGVQGEYAPMGNLKTDPSGKLVQFSEFDIVINPEYWRELKADEDTPELIAHEARHRGMDIIFRNSQTLAKIPKQLQDMMFNYSGGGKNGYPQKGKDPELWDTWEHNCLWSLERRGRTAFGPDYIFMSKEEMLQFRRWYYQLEAVAKEYVATIKVPPGGYEALRGEIDKKTPDTVSITVNPDAEGKPVVIGKLSAEEIERRNKAIQGGANIDKSGKVVGSGNSSRAVSGTYTVKSGDSLSKIGAARGIGLPAMIKANPQIKNPDMIYPGDQVNIPGNL
jgi:LysM repeat protein